MTKYVYTFGNGVAEGNTTMKNELGGKGANLAEMNSIGIPVPPGFTINTEVCTLYYERGEKETFDGIKEEVENAVRNIEQIMGTEFGSNTNPCLVSVRSGARVSMPGMMDTVLNLGLNDSAVEGLAKLSGNEWFAWDSYRRFVQMYGDVVLGMKPESKDEIDPFEKIIEDLKHEKDIEKDSDLSVADLKRLVTDFKDAVHKQLNRTFPDNPWEQLWGAIGAVFNSWNNDRAILYRKLNSIPVEWGTAVNVQAMVFGNMGNTSGTGVAFTRDAATGDNIFNGEYLINAQGEDVVAGIRTPQQITLESSKTWAKLTSVDEASRASKYPSLEETMPAIFKELITTQNKLEEHYSDMQDIEFTIQDGKLWLLQTRSGKRTGAAMVKIASDLLKEGKIDEKTALKRIEPDKLNELLHPVFDTNALKAADEIAKGLPASPGAATGQVVFFADEAYKFEKSILVRVETSPEDLEGMHKAQGILTARGGMTSHAAVVARGMGKCCVSGAGTIKIDYKNRTLTVGKTVYNEGSWISLNGSTGKVYEGKVPTQDASLTKDFETIMELADKYSRLKIRTNADTPKDAATAMKFGASGIGLCRTEHMFFDGDRIKSMRKMILSSTKAGRKIALAELLPYQRQDFEGIFEVMDGKGVTIRLLDPPLHEFVPHQQVTQKELADEMNITLEEVKTAISKLEEFNPMLGHRGCRLGVTYPEITEMQTRAIIEAAINCKRKGMTPIPEIMIPLVGTYQELENQADLIRKTAQTVFEEQDEKVEYLIGTMIEIPRAAITADKISKHCEFFSFGTNDLTQMTFGYSRDDAGKFLDTYVDKKILPADPFQTIDKEGVGSLVKLGIEKGRSGNQNIKIGICGEHGGDPSSIDFFNSAGMDYVSCSPYRVPIARVAAALANI
ncbi:MAG: pyruvate, phosphate dikinase [Bacteroidales bacterium]